MRQLSAFRRECGGDVFCDDVTAKQHSFGVQLFQGGGLLGRAGIQLAGAESAAAFAGMRGRPAAHGDQ